jgi:hypothetical protein
MMPQKPELKKWRIFDYGDVPSNTVWMSEFKCLNCRHESLLPVVGNAIAQLDMALVFDPGEQAVPKVIQCKHCTEIYRTGGE